MRDRWTPEQVDLLQQLWASGSTAEMIAAQLGGLSRSAVLGKISRLRRATTGADAPKMRPTGRPARQNEPPPPPPCCEPKRLLDLTNACCRWPVTPRRARNILFCGAPEADLAGGIPYCAYHAWRAYVIPPKCVAAAKRKGAPAGEQSDASTTSPRRYVWRAPVRHPAPRPR